MYQPLMRAQELAIVAKAIYSLDHNDLACDPDVLFDIHLNIAHTFADHLARTNSQFDRARFLRAATTGVNRPSHLASAS